MTACPVCEDAGTVVVAVGPVDSFGVPDGTVEAPCPHCPAGDAEAEHRIGRPWRTPSQSSRPERQAGFACPPHRSDRDVHHVAAATPAEPGTGVASSSPPQGPLDTTDPRRGDLRDVGGPSGQASRRNELRRTALPCAGDEDPETSTPSGMAATAPRTSHGGRHNFKDAA